MNAPNKEKPRPIDPNCFGLELTMESPLYTMEPSEYLTEVKGEIILEEEDGPVIPGYLSLTLYHLDRAEIEERNPMEVFDCLSEEALELFKEIYDGYDLRKAVRAIVEDVLNPSLLVIETIQVLPQFRGGGLGLAAALKAMHMLGPAGGLVALLAAPLNLPFCHEDMKMEDFAPDSPQVREKLGRYWEQLGFRQLGTDCLYLRNLENLPMISDLLAMQR